MRPKAFLTQPYVVRIKGRLNQERIKLEVNPTFQPVSLIEKQAEMIKGKMQYSLGERLESVKIGPILLKHGQEFGPS